MEHVGQLNPIALRKAKIAYNFGLSECNRVKNNPSQFTKKKTYAAAHN